MKTQCSCCWLKHSGWILPVMLAYLCGPSSIAQCPIASAPTTLPPSAIVRVQVLSIKPNSDMEGDDDYVPFYDNHADIFGKVTIDGQEFDLPEIEDDDFPHWDISFDQQTAVNPVKIVIQAWENDSGLTGANDEVDINPAAGQSALVLDFDVCAMIVSVGSTQHAAQGIIEVKAGNDDNDATIRIKIGTADGRPVTTNDLALVGVDLVQVLFNTPKMIAGKPTIVMASIANNYPNSVSTNVRIVVSGAGVNRNDVFPLTLGPGQVKKEYFYLNNPIRFPGGPNPEQVALLINVEDTGNQHLDPNHCLRANDGNRNRITWKVVKTPVRYELLWTKVGTLLDGFNFASDGQLQENMELGGAYIHGVYPLSFPYQHKAPYDVMPPLTAATDFLTTILSVFGVPADNVIPYALVLELNGVANIVGCDRLLGVLPNKDWFERFSYDFLDDVTGLSLGEFAPRAVIFLPQKEEGTSIGPAMTLPAHELGHTFGLSTDPTIKDSWVCAVDWPILGHSGCGIVGGFDEYKSTVNPSGNPSNGFWIAQGNEPPAISTLLNQEMCGTFCFMAGSPENAHLNWTGANKKWIDPADYDRLVEKLQEQPDPEIIFVSGMISWDDQMYLSAVQHIGAGIPDRDTSFGTYVIRFLDNAGKTLKEVAFPVNWNSADIIGRPRPVTFFAFNVEFPAGARQLQIVNRMSARILGSRSISLNKPVVIVKSRTRSAVRRGNNIELRWGARDADGNAMEYFIMARAEREEGWFPVQLWQTASSANISTAALEPGAYRIKVMASDGVHVSGSNEVQFVVVE